MKDHIFYGKGMGKVKREYKEIYDVIADLNEVVYTGKDLDYKTQKLIAIGITAAHCDETATEKQMRSTMKELKVTQEEIADVLRVVLLLSGQPAFTKGMRILDELTKK